MRTSIRLSLGLGLGRNFPAGIPSEIGAGWAHHQDSTRRLVTSIAFYQILCLRLRTQIVPETTLSNCGRELRGTRILSWQNDTFGTLGVFHQLQNCSLCQQLIVSAGYSLNKVRPKLTPGKPTLGATLPQLGRACSKQGRAGLLQLRAGADRRACFGHSCFSKPLDRHCLKIRKIWPDVRRLAKISCC